MQESSDEDSCDCVPRPFYLEYGLYVRTIKKKCALFIYLFFLFFFCGGGGGGVGGGGRGAKATSPAPGVTLPFQLTLFPN